MHFFIRVGIREHLSNGVSVLSISLILFIRAFLFTPKEKFPLKCQSTLILTSETAKFTTQFQAKEAQDPDVLWRHPPYHHFTT